MMGTQREILVKKDNEYVKNDYVANKIWEGFAHKNLWIQAYVNENWSFYKYGVLKIAPGPVLTMEGCCLVKNSTKECIINVRETQKDVYDAFVGLGEIVEFEIQDHTEKNVEEIFKLPRF